jgi:hypothetical protein
MAGLSSMNQNIDRSLFDAVANCHSFFGPPGILPHNVRLATE